MRLVLFDVDGTLVHSGGQAKPAFAEAMLEVFGTTGAIDAYDFGGKLDSRIVVDLMEGAGFAGDDVRARLPVLRDAYLVRLARTLDPGRVRVLAGVRRILDALAARDDVAIGLLTGNWREGARIKLDGVDLWRYFAFGSFGDDGFDRRELPPVALARAAEHVGRAFTVRDSVIVGDSLLDVDCAAAHGIDCLAVATGWTPAEELARAGARWVVESLDGRETHPAFFEPNE